jgi:hypothetical protein
VHDLKCWTIPFAATESGKKRFEFRKNDRGYEVGDTLVLRLWDPSTGSYRPYIHALELHLHVTYIAHGPDFGIPEGYCIMSTVLVTIVRGPR